MRKLLLVTAAAALGLPAMAHDFWLQPRQFSIPRPASVGLNMLVGHGAARDRWGVAADRVVMFRTIGPDGVLDRRPELSLGAAQGDASVQLARAGAYVLVLQSTRAASELPALRFNDYVAEEGITPIAAERRRRGTEQADGRELYSRRAKAIVQVGPVDASSIARVTRPAGLQLEIVPGKHPLAIGPDRRLPVRVLYEGKPLAGALVKLTDLAADAEPVATRRTSADGRADFVLRSAGQWQMNVIWASPLRNEARADFDTTFSSLTFASVN